MRSAVCCVLFALASLAAAEKAAEDAGKFWPRWEERTLDCSAGPRPEDCVLHAPTAKTPRDPKNFTCREEPLPANIKHKLSKNSKTRIACPIGCEEDPSLSVLQKTPYINPNCQKYYTYGKYFENGDWYLWQTAPCHTSITTHCRFKDIRQG